jgi:hypothetical protein
MSASSKFLVIGIGAFVGVMAFIILNELLSPGAFNLVILLALIALFVGVLINWKIKERAEQRAEAEFREKYPPASVTRLPIKRK